MSKINKDIITNQNGNKNDVWEMMVKNRLEKLFVEDREHENRYGLHASAIIASDDEFCYREQVLSLFYKMNQGEQLPVNTLKIFAQGNAMHEKWYKLFQRQGIDIAIERTLYLEKYDLSFTIDALLNIFDEELVCDIKSMNTYTFQKTKGHPSGEKQVNFYLWALSKYTGVPHKKGFVLIDDKNTQDIKVVPVLYDKEKVLPYVQRLKDVQEMKKLFIKENELPRKKCKTTDCKRAAKCSMRDACFNIGQGRVRLEENGKR